MRLIQHVLIGKDRNKNTNDDFCSLMCEILNIINNLTNIFITLIFYLELILSLLL